jgi:hypothetical protein
MSKLISKVTPLFNRVLVKRFAAETKTAGGIILPTSAQVRVCVCIAIYVCIYVCIYVESEIERRERTMYVKRA